MWYHVELSLLSFMGLLVVTWSDFNPNMDNVFFSINWPGKGLDWQELDNKEALGDGRSIVLTTTDNEKYRCVIPEVTDDSDEENIRHYDGPSEMEIIGTLFQQKSCSYRVESYWTYELCHGKYFRQYHEEKEMGKKPKVQEYFLGYYEKQDGRDTSAEASAQTQTQIPAPPAADEEKPQVPVKKVDGLEVPYFRVEFTGGTTCDLTGEPRRLSLHYVCQPEGKGEIYELKEVSTCEYEVTVLTKLLCSHPAYIMKKDPVNEIQCHSIHGSPRRPKSLDVLELENTLGRYNRRQHNLYREEDENDFEDEEDEDDYVLDEEDEEMEEEEMSSSSLPKQPVKTQQDKPVQQRVETPLTKATDKQLLSEFLRGEYCIQGGSGWWKHEFCYGKSVTQFHEEKNSRVTIVLGHWDEELHIRMMKEFASKRPKRVGQQKQVLHYYGNGDECDVPEGKKKRVVEVKLKCKANSASQHSISIYLVEPKMCEYILVVESPIFCDLIDKADEYGLLKDVVP